MPRKDRVQVAGSLAALARTGKIEPIDQDDTAITFMPPFATVEELSPTGARPASQADAGAPNIDATPPTKMASPAASPQAESLVATGAQPRQRNRARSANSPKDTASWRKPVNKAESADYTRVTLRLHNDTITRLVALGLSRNKRYTTLIEEYIMAGLERHDD